MQPSDRIVLSGTCLMLHDKQNVKVDRGEFPK